MARPRNIPIDLAEGTSKIIRFFMDDAPDLSSAEIVMTVKRHAVDEDAVIVKTPDLDLSTKLDSGEFVISVLPADTIDLEPRTYVYEVKITIEDDIYIPLIGDFNVFNSISQ